MASTKATSFSMHYSTTIAQSCKHGNISQITSQVHEGKLPCGCTDCEQSNPTIDSPAQKKNGIHVLQQN